jgi:hypothetical protein
VNFEFISSSTKVKRLTATGDGNKAALYCPKTNAIQPSVVIISIKKDDKIARSVPEILRKKFPHHSRTFGWIECWKGVMIRKNDVTPGIL